MSNPIGSFVCACCSRHFLAERDLTQHQIHSLRCRARAFRNGQETESRIKFEMAKTPDQRAIDHRRTIENIQIIAVCYGSKTILHPMDRTAGAISALDTIARIASQSLLGG